MDVTLFPREDLYQTLYSSDIARFILEPMLDCIEEEQEEEQDDEDDLEDFSSQVIRNGKKKKKKKKKRKIEENIPEVQ